VTCQLDKIDEITLHGMNRTLRPTLYFFGLVIIAVLSIMVDISGVLQSQVLRAPERLETVKLIRQETNPVQYDIYYQGLKEPQPKDVTLFFINGLVQVGDRFENRIGIVDQVLLSTGQDTLTSGSNQQVLNISGLSMQATSKLGTIITPFSPLELVSLEYDFQVGSERKTLLDNPVPRDFPQGFTTFQNPTNELMYVRTADTHDVLGFGERLFTRNQEVSLAALLLPDTLTTFQELDQINRGNLTAQAQSIPAPDLTVEQGQIVVPSIPSQDLNLLVIRMRNAQSDWSYHPFLMSSSADITLPVAVSDLLDFYTDVEYSFGHIGNAFHTMQLDFPFETLLPGEERPIFYRTAYRSLTPELSRDRSSLELVLQVNVAPSSDGIYIGFLSRELISSLDRAVDRLQQKLPVVIFDEASRRFDTRVQSPSQLPNFHLLGTHDQLWTHPTNERSISMVSPRFEHIPVPDDELILDDIELIQLDAGDRLLCFVRTDEGDFSVSPVASHVASNGDCLQAAKRAGFSRGEIFPVVYRADQHRLEGLMPFTYDELTKGRSPQIASYDPYENTFSLSETLGTDTLQLLSSSSPDFESFATLIPERLQSTSFTIPVLPACENHCYLKVARIHPQRDDRLIASLSETLLYSSQQSPTLQLCFTDLPFIDELFDPAELDMALLLPDGSREVMSFQNSSDCYVLAQESDEDSEESEEPSEQSLSDWTIVSEHLPPETLVIQSNGLENNHITIPPQRHYVSLRNGSEHQLLQTSLVYQHLQMQIRDDITPDAQRHTSYQISHLGDQAEVFAQNRGTILLNSPGDTPAILEKLPVRSPINETLLFPGGRSSLATPNTIRFLPAEEVLIQGFDEVSKLIQLALPVPNGSTVQLFFENLFRPEIQMEQLVTSGINFDPQSGYLSLQNPSGTIVIPVEVSTTRATDTSFYEQTFPETTVPDDIDLVSVLARLAITTQEPSDIPNSSLLEPLVLDRAQAGFPYELGIDFGGIEDAESFELQGSTFLSQSCDEAFDFDLETRNLTGQVPNASTLEACYLVISLRYLVQLPYAQMEVSTDRHYQIPITNPQNTPPREPEELQIPVNEQSSTVDQVIVIHDAVESLLETNEDFQDIGSEAGLIQAIGDLSIVFDAVNQQIVISGDSSSLITPERRYFRAIDRETGQIRRFVLEFLPVKNHEVIVPIVQGFPNQLDVPIIIEGLNFSDQELSTLRVLEDSLSEEITVSDRNVVTVFGLPELNDQVLPVLIDRELTTPTAFESFEDRLSGGEEEIPESMTVRIDLRLQVSEPEEIRLEAIPLNTGKRIVLDLRQVLPQSNSIVTNQLPAFLTRNGTQLQGTTPSEPQQVDILIQDYSFVRNIILPLDIRLQQEAVPVDDTPEDTDTNPDPEPDTTSNDDAPLRGAGVGVCFPDIFDQPFEYQQAICIAEEFGIISGSGGTFKPNDPINRAEVSKILVSGPLVLFDILSRSELSQLRLAFPGSSFRDVNLNAWFFGFVETVREIGIVDGHPDGTFRPANQLNHAEAAKLIVNTLRQLEPGAFSAEETIAKNTLPGDPWYAPYVRIMNLNGGDLPEPNETELLTLPISRAQFLYNLMILLDTKSGVLKNLITAEN